MSLVKRLASKFKRIFKGTPAEPPEVWLENVAVSRTKPVFFVAEIGLNHNGYIEVAKKLIDAAADAGAQAVKFQKRNIPLVFSDEDLAKPKIVPRDILENAIKRGALPKESIERLVKSDFKNTTNGDSRYAREFNESEYRELFDHAKNKGVLFFASAWDQDSIDFLEKFNPPCHKVASAMLTDKDFLRKIRQTGRPVIVSTGMSTLEDVKKALAVLGERNVILLHTVSTYPARDIDLNLRAIPKFRRYFPMVQIGYSGHEQGIAPSVAASVMGARLIERHITLDKKMYGTDQAASLEPHEFKDLVQTVRLISSAIGTGVKSVIEGEVPIMKELRKAKTL